MSNSIRMADSWNSFKNIKYIVVFGDSFSAVGYNSNMRKPSAENPLGVGYPGLTSCERVDESTQEVTFEPNWVGHLVQAVNDERKDDPLLVYDYATSGDTIARMKLKQIRREFHPHLAPHPAWAPWSATDTLFITWIGLNDCSWNIRLRMSSAQASLDDLFVNQEALYEAGARNFCLIDLPPVHTFPGGPTGHPTAWASWNALLREGAEKFAAAHSDATVLIFSSWDVFTKVLADPTVAGLPQGDATDRGALFVDGFHPASTLHAVIAKALLVFLETAS
ncbi:hypothetical protein C8Q74DRAFT_1223444 [Fomes fomentarius]|nr:hypothetical protein C8Q74DRAFT_1223444 [Fomes fomentarius]